MVAYVFIYVYAVITGLLGPGPGGGDPDDPWYRVFTHPLLREVFHEIYGGSPTFAEAMDSMGGGFPIKVGLLSELDEINRHRPRNDQLKPNPQTGAVAAYARDADGVAHSGTALFDIDRIHQLSRGQPGAPVDSVRARNAIRDAMIHELYGHIAPVAKRGEHIPDPGRRESFPQSAIGQRENVIREELGLPPRTSYGLFN